METNSFIGLPYREVKRLMMKSCEYIEKLSSSLLVMERCDQTLSEEYCATYESLLLERLDICRKLNEFYIEDRKRSCWLFRWLIDRHIIQVSQLHKETLSQLMLLRNYRALSTYMVSREESGKFID